MFGSRIHAERLDDGRPRLARGLVLLAVLSLLGNLAGSALRYTDIGAAVLFPPYAVLTAALVLSRRRDWAWYVLVAVAAHVATHWPRWSLSWVLMADVANVARALCAAALLRLLNGHRARLDGIRDLAVLVVSAALVAPALGATIGAANVVWHGAAPDYWLPWRAWFMSNALTGLSMLPACLLLFARAAGRVAPQAARRRALEAVALALALAGTCAFAFLPGTPGQWHPDLAFYAPLPVLIWAALRFGSGGASLAFTAVVFAAIWSADRGRGPFSASSADEAVLTLQIFVLLTALPVLCIAALDGARQGVVRLYRSLLASLQDQVAILDARGVVLEVNDSWRQAGAATHEPLHGAGPGADYLAACRSAAERGDAEAGRARAGVASVLAGEQRRFEMEYERHGGEEGQKVYVLRVEALERPDGGAVVTRTDVTARRRALREVEDQRRQVSHLARVAVLGQLSGALAHELNQPLTSILSNADAARHLLQRQPVDLEELAAILGDIASEDRRAADVIQRLRALLKRGEARVQGVDAGELVAEVLKLAHPELIARRVTASLSVDPDLPPVLGDRVQLQQVLLNLILNGCEAMTATEVAQRALSLTVHSEDGHAHLAVRDHGTGIAPALVERLFEPFVTTKAEGLGLGLSISRTIVDAHGGKLWAENNPDGGATLHCLLPISSPRPGDRT